MYTCDATLCVSRYDNENYTYVYNIEPADYIKLCKLRTSYI